MAKKLLAALLAACLMAPGVALAEVWQGTTVAGRTVALTAEASGALDWLDVEVGGTIDAGERVGAVHTTRVYASQDGTVATLTAQAGDSVDGTVLALAPVDPYAIYCTVEGAYDDSAAQRIRAGETVFIRCAIDGSHRAVGVVVMVEGDEYRVVPTGGELYVGEAVEVYRDEACSEEQCVGVGTVLQSDVETYSAQGTIAQVYVAEGERVERGELLFECVSGDSAELVSPASGVVVSVTAAEGDRVEAGTTIAQIAPIEEIQVEIRVGEADLGSISVGDRAAMILAWESDAREVGGTIVEISALEEDGTYAVRVAPDEPIGWIGLTVEVRTGG